MLEKPLKLRELITRYAAMRRLDDFTPQSRGMALNKLIADALDCYGIRAKASVRKGYGEIDVTFTIEGIRFVLEAKWEHEKADTGMISKLQRRVKQRLITTIGVFVSMAGYTADAVEDVNIGERLEVLLLDRNHLEAMVSGVVPPEELFGLLIDKASYEGGPYYPLEALLPQPTDNEPVVRFGSPERVKELVHKSRPGVLVEPLLYDLPTEYIGLASVTTNQLVLNYPEGLVRVDLQRRSSEWHAALPATRRHTLPMDDGSLLFFRQYGVGALRDGRLHIIAGGFVGDAILFSDDDGNAWALDNGRYLSSYGHDSSANATLVQLDDELGAQTWTPTAIQGGLIADAVWVDKDRIAAVGAGVLEVIDPHAGSSTRHLVELTNTMSVCKLNEDLVLTVANGNIIAVLGLDGRTVLPLAEFNVNVAGAASELCPAGDGTFFMFSTYRVTPTTDRGIVLRVGLPHNPLALDI